MTRNYRLTIEIVRDILSISTTKVKRTKIMYACNLSFVTLNTYTNLLVNKGLLEQFNDENGVRVYLITQRGREVLEKCNRAISLYYEVIREIGVSPSGRIDEGEEGER
jgi:predicted transcriptional regulator